MLVVALLLCFTVALASGYPDLSCEDQVRIENLFLEVLDSHNYGTDATPGDTAAKWVRLAFHDAGTWDPASGTGGAHAYIGVQCGKHQQCERTLDDNAGLAAVSDNLEALWQGWKTVISRSDFWHLAAKVGIEWASGGTAQINWGWGRTDANKVAYFPDRHPDADKGFSAIHDHLVTRLGFSWEEAIALLGAHSLGETHFENTGYHGRWVPKPANFFSNNFYKILLTYNWFPVTVPCNKTTGCEKEYNTNGLPGGLLLSIDAGTKWNPDSELTCTIAQRKTSVLWSHRCPLASNVQGIVEHFANDNNYWLSTFATAFEKLQNFGGDTLYYNSPSDVQYDLSQTHWQGFNGWYTNQNDYGWQYGQH